MTHLEPQLAGRLGDALNEFLVKLRDASDEDRLVELQMAWGVFVRSLEPAINGSKDVKLSTMMILQFFNLYFMLGGDWDKMIKENAEFFKQGDSRDQQSI